MHEFVCSESTPTMPLSVSDMATREGQILLGDIFMSVCPKDIVSNRLLFTCKQFPSLLDVVAGTGHIVENVPRAMDLHSTNMEFTPSPPVTSSKPSESSNASETRSASMMRIVDTSTCMVSCARCLSVLGDGQITEDDVGGGVDNSSSCDGKIQVVAPPVGAQFTASDLQDIRFLRDRVKWNAERNVSGIETVLKGSRALSVSLGKSYESEKVLLVIVFCIYIHVIFVIIVVFLCIVIVLLLSDFI